MENSPDSVRENICAWFFAGKCPGWLDSNLIISALQITLWAILGLIIISFIAQPIVNGMIKKYKMPYIYNQHAERKRYTEVSYKILFYSISISIIVVLSVGFFAYKSI